MGKQKLLLCVAQFLVFSGCTIEAESTGFDFTHVNLALQYFDRPSENLKEEIAASEAALHLKRHSDRTGYYPPDTTTLEITSDLLDITPGPNTLEQVSSLVGYATDHPSRQQSCTEESAAYLPAEARPVNPLHITWGYDIGVAMDDHASLNFAHPHFLEDPEEIWFYCIHEMHHAGVMQLQRMPRIADIDSVGSLHDFVRYATFLEGLAVYAAKEARQRSGALGRDRDYVALGNSEQLALIMQRYWQRLSFLESQKSQPLDDTHWQVVEEMSSGDRLWYVAGAAMAAVIDDKVGRDGLLTVIREGPGSFFDTFARVEP